MTPWIARVIEALRASKLEVIFVRKGAAAILGEPLESIDLVVRDTPLHRMRLQDVTKALGCVQVPLSNTARSVELVGGPCPVDVRFESAAAYGSVRARAKHVGEALVARIEGRGSFE